MSASPKTLVGSFQYPNGRPLAFGRLHLRLSQDAQILGGGTISVTDTVVNLTGAGAIPANTKIYSNDDLLPPGTFYVMSVVAAGGALVYGPQSVSLTGAEPINVTTLIPNSAIKTKVSISINPTSAVVLSSASQQFTATVRGAGNNTGVLWYVDNILGGTAVIGTISPNGLYTPPQTSGNHTITAVAAADPTKKASASASITIEVVSVSVAPTSTTLQIGQQQQFAALVTGLLVGSTAVSWLVDGAIGGSPTSGVISSSGLYTAPSVSGGHLILARSVTDTTKSASASVTVTAVGITLSPSTALLRAGTIQQFTATLTGTSNTAAVWSVDGVIGGNANVGTIDNTGLYTAPSSAGGHTITATSAADPTKSVSASVTVEVVGISISPPSTTLNASATQQFTATVTGTTNLAVQWSVDGVVGGNTSVGVITTSGFYTAPTSAGGHTVTVTSLEDPTQSASASVTVQVVQVSIAPTAASLITNQVQQFTATVTGAADPSVVWDVDGIRSGNSTVGTVDGTGLYTAPAGAGNHTVTATSVADGTKSASATVSVSVVAVAVAPSTVSLPFGGSQQFTAVVSGTSNQSVVWFVDNIQGGNATVGTIDNTGFYNAPNASGTHTVKAVSQVDATKSGTATVNTAAVAVTISPTSAEIYVSTSQTFVANVAGALDNSVVWSVDGIVGGSPTVGTVTVTGVYTAPASAGQHTVKATSNADPTQSASAIVTVDAAVTVTVTPASVDVLSNNTQPFIATVANTSNTGVTWYVNNILGGDLGTVGSIDQTGLYTAPDADGTFTVKAVSNFDNTKFGIATVMAHKVSISISPTSASVIANQTVQFTATVSNAGNKTGVDWLVDGRVGGIASTGTIDTNGLYTAPATAGAHTVSARSQADKSKKANAAVTVTVIAVNVSPATASVTANGSQQFTATVTGAGSNTGVIWQVNGITGGGPGVGTISVDGLYTAPATAGTRTISAVSLADGTKQGNATVTVTVVSVSVSPTSANLTVSQSQQFTAVVTGAGSNTGVNWAVDGIAGGSSTVGTITTNGFYTAPPTAGSHSVTATSVADPSKSATATVTVTVQNVTVTVSPTSTTIAASTSVQLTATVTGNSNTAVTWQVNGVTGGNSTFGTITSSGLYTAPNYNGSFTVTAISQADVSKNASCAVTVNSGSIAVTVTPANATITPSSSQQYTATVTGTSITGVVWYVDNIAGGNATVGTISGSGLYTAPSSGGSHTIKAISQADTNVSGSTTVSINSLQPVPNDYIVAVVLGLPPGWGFWPSYGNNYGNRLWDAGMSYFITSTDDDPTNMFNRFAGITTGTTGLNQWLPGLRATRTDHITGATYNAKSWVTIGARAIYSFYNTGTSGTCGSTSSWSASFLSNWSSFIDQLCAYYGKGKSHDCTDIIRGFEIWNEPDANCSVTGIPGSTTATCVANWIALAQIAYAKMHAAGFEVGGPAPQSSASDSTGFIGVLGQAGGGQYLDVVTRHHYRTSPEIIATKLQQEIAVAQNYSSLAGKPWIVTEFNTSLVPFNSYIPEDQALAFVQRAYILSWALGRYNNQQILQQMYLWTYDSKTGEPILASAQTSNCAYPSAASGTNGQTSVGKGWGVVSGTTVAQTGSCTYGASQAKSYQGLQNMLVGATLGTPSQVGNVWTVPITYRNGNSGTVTWDATNLTNANAIPTFTGTHP